MSLTSSKISADESFFKRTPLILKILYVMRKLKIFNTEIFFLWVPSHTGIHGNTVVDQESKNAMNDPKSKCEIPYTVFKSNIRKYVLNIWKNAWSNRNDNKLHEIKPTLCKPLNKFINRKDQCVISRCW